MRIVVAVVGKARHQALGAAAREYEGRAARYWPLEVREVREERGAAPPSRVRELEGRRLLDVAGPRARLVACDPAGRAMSSEQFAAWLQREREAGRDVCFAIGGAMGLSPAVLDAAHLKLNLAPWTLPHELARVVLAEQLYRAGTIVRREPYHK